jgi:alpha-amylase/alpha-mannosidase (GH57 family)
MNAPLQVVFLWHMHQPYYVNPLTRTAMMPWVRLHAVKGYLDMIEVALRFPELRVTFNFTPVLVRQLRELAEESVRDAWEDLALKPASELEPAEQTLILEHFFKIHWGNLIEPYPRYRELLEMRGRQFNPRSLREAAGLFTPQDYRDLQTWFNLNWCGFSAFRRYPELGELRAKGRGFTEDEKRRVLEIHRAIIRDILPTYRRAQEEGRIELTTTPFFHPIMPLVYDTEIAARAMPGRKLPQRFSAPEDVRAHLRLAQEEHERAFGRRARGMWPSEGSVAPEILPLMREAGIEYFCTDEDILFRSLEAEGRKADHLELFQPWRCRHGDAAVKALFRERPLSDFVGFNAARNSPEQAANYLIHHLEHIADVARAHPPTLLLALDGENAWEAFPDGGEAFLGRMYQGILSSAKLRTVLLGQAVDAAEHPPEVHKLHSGSWIGGNFDIWIGDPEENLAWERIGQTREFLTYHLSQHTVDPAVAEAAWMEIYAAEGSDWFWWYGPDFHTDTDMLFDELFRLHLQNVYHILGVPVPYYLEVPIRQRGRAPGYTRPSALITPAVDGRAGGYFDWVGAGHLDVGRQQTAMFQADRMLVDLFYGFDHERFYLRLDFAAAQPEEITVVWSCPRHGRVRMVRGGGASWEVSRDGVAFERMDVPGLVVAWGRRVELALPLHALGLAGCNESTAFFVQLWRGGVEQERHPERGFIEFEGPSAEFTKRHWFV